MVCRSRVSIGNEKRAWQKGARSERGFTLLEVLVALAIAIPALLLFYREGGLSLNLSSSAAAYNEAVSRAQSRLDSLVDTALQPGERSGEDGSLYRWRTRVVPVIAGLAGTKSAGSVYASGTTLYAIAVEISWPGPDRNRQVELETRRLGPAVGESP